MDDPAETPLATITFFWIKGNIHLNPTLHPNGTFHGQLQEPRVNNMNIKINVDFLFYFILFLFIDLFIDLFIYLFIWGGGGGGGLAWDKYDIFWVKISVTFLHNSLQAPGPWLNTKMSSCQYRKSHCGEDKTVVISYTGKMSSSGCPRFSYLFT